MNTTQVVAHRGAKAEAPENTFAAFDKALEYEGVQGIELDVQLTRDGVPVVFHDNSLWRMRRRLTPVRALSLEELQSVDVGSWYHPRFRGAQVPSLEETLKKYGMKTHLYIEIKVPVRPSNATIKRIIRCMVPVLRNYQEKHPKWHFSILCFDRRILRLIHRQQPQWRYVLNLTGPRALRRTDFATLHFLQAVCVNISNLTAAFAEKIQDRGLMLMTYTSNRPRQVRKNLSHNVDFLMTDDPKNVIPLIHG